MNGTSGGPHLLLFERDQQLTALLSGELALAGYEVHMVRTAVEVFDTIARFPVRLVMINLAQAQAGRREFWIALDTQRRGRSVQVFTYRCTNVGGYGPDDPDERVETVLTDLEVDGRGGIAKLVDGVRARVPGSTTVASAPTRPALAVNRQEAPPTQNRGQSVQAPSLPQASPASLPPQASPVHQSSPMSQPSPPYQPLAQASAPPQASPASQSAPLAAPAQPLQGTLRPQLQEVTAPARPADASRSGRSTFTDKIRAVIYPSSRNASSQPSETSAPQYYQAAQTQGAEIQSPVSRRYVEAEPVPTAPYREEMPAQAPDDSQAPTQAYPIATSSAFATETRATGGESGLDQLSRMLRESHPVLHNATIYGNVQSTTTQAGLSIDPQEIQEFHANVLQAARQDEEYGRVSMPRVAESTAMGAQLRASPIQDVPFEQEIAYRRGIGGGELSPISDTATRSAMSILQPTQAIPPVQQTPQILSPVQQASPVQSAPQRVPSSAQELSPAPEAPVEQLSPSQEDDVFFEVEDQPTSGPSGDDEYMTVADPLPISIQQTLSRHSDVRTSDDLLLDIVKSLPPMSPAARQALEQPPVLNGRATRSLGSVLLEGHLVPQERLQVAQQVQRMLRGVDLNYQLGEILLMFKLLTPDQLLAASLVSYGMISTVQITGLGRIRQELYTMGLEYDLESLLILFRILTPDQMREVRASWSS